MEVSRVIIAVVAMHVIAHRDAVNAAKVNRCIFNGLSKVNVVFYEYRPFLPDTVNVSIPSLESGKIKGITSQELLKCFLRPCRGANIIWNITTIHNEQELLERLKDNETNMAYPVPSKVQKDYQNSDSSANFNRITSRLYADIFESNDQDVSMNGLRKLTYTFTYVTREEETEVDFLDHFAAVKGSKTQAHFVNIVNCRTDRSLVIFTLIYRQWPIFTLMLLLAGIAGVIVWLLESRDNDEEFTTPFFPGGFDGFWWAFISMTTVGYGDKTPRSLIGRLFSVLWILVGITIVSFFTATITSAITIATVKNSCEQIENRTIAVLGLQEEVTSYIQNNGGKPKEYSQATKMFDALNNEKNEIDSMLIDVGLANLFGSQLSKERNIKKVKAVELQKSDVLFHLMVRYPKNNSMSCTQEYELDKIPANNSRIFEYAGLEEEVVQPLSLDSPETWPFMYVLGFGLVGMVILGFVLDMLLRLRRRHRAKNHQDDDDDDTCLDVNTTSTAAESSTVVAYHTRHALGTLTQDMKEMKGLMQKTMERLAMIEKLVESNTKQE